MLNKVISVTNANFSTILKTSIILTFTIIVIIILDQND